ncbi:MAG: hypothetical protein COS11_04900 [bacterium (Candidatus Ratteibacteria) CG01_land_8_20_14_3_00_40_19]|uniref:Uncharacterized protein n=1 Tax=bacterium (Candidatus Ratteibacteria) CG01_land_8_20_14_3_00_40_19 TaxID=2014290 RepID=A0A2M7E845_9BACT|nr:MAG: hypothetical protein COS11_04900 [bacterium (Candidatus Ratteibacteria) CG01_land_8_20_14_3_00_40_19]
MPEVDVSKCPKCSGRLSRVWGSKNIFKCERGCLLRLVFESEIRNTDREKVIWVDQEEKEYPAEIIEN